MESGRPAAPAWRFRNARSAAGAAGVIRTIRAIRSLRAVRVIGTRRMIRPLHLVRMRAGDLGLVAMLGTGLRMAVVRSADHVAQFETERLGDLAPAFTAGAQCQHALH